MKGKGKCKVTNDFGMSDDDVVLPETPMPHVHSRYHVIEDPGKGNVTQLFGLSNQSQQWNLTHWFTHSLQ